ncbi:MAG: dTDP-4-dehydrorhamnose reductase [Alistipes sp.]|nr:dTDP-4-dehydrorhamnose reductase [Alistipes sp.]
MANRILVTGANGQLGNEIRATAKDSADSYIFTDIAEDGETVYLDITDLDAVRKMIADNGVNIIINCAAYTNVDKAEEEREKAKIINATAPANLAKAIKEFDGLLVHISTDYVFGGESDTPYTEEQPTAPKSVYGSTKLTGEEAIIATDCRYIIIRTAWLYSEFGKNFCKTMINLTSTKSQIKVVDDQIGTPTYALDLARAIVAVVARYDGTQRGIFHYSNEGICSWFEFAKAISELYGTTECDIQPCTSAEYPSIVKRPAYSALDKGKIKAVFGVDVPHWRDSLARCIRNIKKQ